MITIYLKQYNKIIRNADTKLFDELGYDDILWIDMLLPTIKEQKAVENFMEISLQTKQQVEEIESTSKYSEDENAIISNSNFFVPTGDTFIVEPVSFIISNEGVLVSVRSAEFRTFRETEKRLQMNYRSYSTGYHLFISLLEVRIDFDADLVELIAKQVAALSKDINIYYQEVANGTKAFDAADFKKVAAVYAEMAEIIGIFEQQEKAAEDDGLTDKLMEIIITLRQDARKEKNWAVADKIRDALKDAGVVLEDTPSGVRWKKA